MLNGIPWALESWRMLETSMASPWRPPIYPFKTVLPLAVGLLTLQGAVAFGRSLATALGRESHGA
jgi:TRAP-type mannitol/chloroaromatic compound transport system permease small subunit